MQKIYTWNPRIFEHSRNHYNVIGTSINIYHWNSGKNTNYLVVAGYKDNAHIEKTIPGKGPAARENAIIFALSIREKYLV